jgi:hypothetical protein
MSKILQLKIQLKDVAKPPIWRKVEVSADDTFYDLHNIIQGAMGWYNAHLHQFVVGHQYIGLPSPYDDDMEKSDSRKIKLGQIFKTPKTKLFYEYDFGDSWIHLVTLEGITEVEKGVIYPRLTSGKSACPPEDCGGCWGYEDLKEAVNDPKHESYQDLRDWLELEKGEVFDPNEFDLAAHQSEMMDLYKSGKKTKGKEFMI